MEDNSQNSNSNILDKVKNEVSGSNIDVTKSIEEFNNNIFNLNKCLNPNSNINNDIPNQNEQNLKTSSDIDIDSPSEQKLFFKVKNNNFQNKNKVSSNIPSDILRKKLQNKIDTLNYDNFVLNKKNKDLASKIDELNFNLNSVNQAKKTEIVMLTEQLDSVKNNLKKIEKENYELNEIIKNKDSEIKELKLKNKLNFELKAENDKLKKKIKNLDDNINNLKEELSFKKNELNKIKFGNDSSKNGKEIKNNFIINQKNRELIEQNEDMKKEIDELKNDKKNIIKNFKDSEYIKQNEYEKKYNIEKERFEEQLNYEIERIKSNEKIKYELKIKELETINEDLNYKIEELKKKIENNDNDNEIDEIKKSNANLKDEISYLNLQIQLKDSENSRLNRIYKENIDLIGELNNENNQLKEKINLLSNKLKEISSLNLNEMAEANKKINILSSKAQSYEEQDNTFDKLFSEILLNDENTNTNKDEESKNLIIAINQMPPGNNKRISQCKFMASRLKKLYQEKEILNAKIENLNIENNKYKEEGNIMKNIEQGNNESYEFLLKELEKKDSELMYLKEAVKDREIRFKQVMKENEDINAKCNSLQKDLVQILENRDKINKLDYLVKRIAENQKKFLGKENFEQTKISKNKEVKNDRRKYK